MDYKDLAIKWFNKANNDLTAGIYIISMPYPLEEIIYLCQKNQDFRLNQIEIM